MAYFFTQSNIDPFLVNENEIILVQPFFLIKKNTKERTYELGFYALTYDLPSTVIY